MPRASPSARRCCCWRWSWPQGLIGFTQYFLDLPIALVALHLLGAAAFSAALTWLLLSVRERP